MKKLLLITALILTRYLAISQPYAIGTTTITFTDPSRGNRSIETAIFYPAANAGTNVPVSGNGISFPVIAFGHGFVMTTAAYGNISSALVPQGYIVAFPKTESGILPDHNAFGEDLAFVISSIQTAGNNVGNLFYGKVATTSCVMGHSMGGGASFLAVQYLPSITAIAGLAPAETNPTASGAASAVSIPALIFAGGNDCVTPAAQHSQLIYNNLNSSCKSYITILGGSHCQFANQNFNCSFGEATCSPSPTISRATQQNIVNQYLIPWLNFRLKNQCQQWYAMQNQIAVDPSVSLLQDCATPVQCLSPLGRKTKYITKKSAFLKWSPPNCWASFEVRYKPAASLTWNIISGINTNTCQLTGLTANTAYEWSVRAICDSTSGLFSTWGPKQTFTTLLFNPASRLSVLDPDEKVAVSPNPSKGSFQIHLTGANEGKVELKMMDMMGRKIHQEAVYLEEGANTITINVPEAKSGIYLLSLFDGTSQMTFKVLIKE